MPVPTPRRCCPEDEEEAHPGMKAIAQQQRAPGIVEGLPKLGAELAAGMVGRRSGRCLYPCRCHAPYLDPKSIQTRLVACFILSSEMLLCHH